MWICRPRHQKKFMYTGYSNIKKVSKQNSSNNSESQIEDSIEWLKLSKNTSEHQGEYFHQWLQEIQSQNNKIIEKAKQNYEDFMKKMDLVEQVIEKKIKLQKNLQYDIYDLQKEKQLLIQQLKDKQQIVRKLQNKKQLLAEQQISNQQTLRKIVSKNNQVLEQTTNNKQTQTVIRIQSVPKNMRKRQELYIQYSEIKQQLLRTLNQFRDIRNQFKSFVILNEAEQQQY